MPQYPEHVAQYGAGEDIGGLALPSYAKAGPARELHLVGGVREAILRLFEEKRQPGLDTTVKAGNRRRQDLVGAHDVSS